MKHLKDFYNLYPVQKTLRFKLEPVGKTEVFIERNQVLESDERRAAEYLKVKEYIDRYHRQFIENALSKPLLKVESQGRHDSLEDFADCYNNDNSEKRSENLEKIQDKFKLKRQTSNNIFHTSRMRDQVATRRSRDHAAFAGLVEGRRIASRERRGRI